MLVILVITCLVGLFDFSTADTLNSCTFDRDCYKWGDDYCIFSRCYSKKSYGYSCNHDRQCYESYQRCSVGKCGCNYGYKWLRTRCVSDNTCDYNSDCSVNYHCSGNRCYYSGTWSTGQSVGVTIGVLIIVVAIIAAIEYRRRRARQLTQALLQSQATTTVVQPTYIAQPGPAQPVYQVQPTVATGYNPASPQYGKY